MSVYSKNLRISAILPAYLVDEIRNISSMESVPQSSIIKWAVECWLKEKLKRDAKALSRMKFDDLPSEDDWLVIQNEV
ncbi:MAG: hypothetical protein WCW77_05740 [Patescibacteria group bacterium]|jgi:hypothetical protein